MSENDITSWIAKISKAIWTGIGEGAPYLVDVIGEESAKILDAKPVTWFNPNQQRRLRNAVIGVNNYTDNLSKTEAEILAERELNVPHAFIVEEGGETAVNPKVAAKFYHLYKQSGDEKYKWAYLSAKLKWKTKFSHKKHPFIAPAYERINSAIIEKVIYPHIETELTKIPNLEVIIG